MCVCVLMLYYLNIIYYVNLIEYYFSFIALRESPIKRRSRLSKIIPGSEQDKEILSTPITTRNDRTGLQTSPIERRLFETTPLQSHQSDTR